MRVSPFRMSRVPYRMAFKPLVSLPGTPTATFTTTSFSRAPPGGPDSLSDVASDSSPNASSSPSVADFLGTATPTRKTPHVLWVRYVRKRIGKCLAYGCTTEQTRRAAVMLRTIAKQWRELCVATNGFVVGSKFGLENQQLGWGDMAGSRFVSQAALMRHIDTSRMNFFSRLAGNDPARRETWQAMMTSSNLSLELKTFKAKYFMSLRAPDTISIYHRPSTFAAQMLHSRAPEDLTAVSLTCAIYSHRHRCLATLITEDVSVWDYRKYEVVKVPSFMRNAFRGWDQVQLQQETWARKHIGDLLMDVRHLELETWDREGSVEDMGTGAVGADKEGGTVNDGASPESNQNMPIGRLLSKSFQHSLGGAR
ncbi:hypothetical protein GGR50DRAFT_508042 [Xylaria sp. CBS 124048]|nr:hypothetical protein GGR50DRAFT_508042 [Xylaria sp. CBS 124048]